MPAAYLLLLRDGPDGTEVLLHLRRNTGYRDDHWAVVAGHVEHGESVLDAAVREAAEEAGVTVRTGDLVPLCTVHRTLRGGGPIDERADFFLAARTWAGEPRIMEPRQGGARWGSSRCRRYPSRACRTSAGCSTTWRPAPYRRSSPTASTRQQTSRLSVLVDMAG